MNAWLEWGGLAASVGVVAGYEYYAHLAGRRNPLRQARFINARMRGEWARAVMSQSGFEVVAVQALRNTLMSSTIAASTAALALMAALTIGGASIYAGLSHWPTGGVGPLHVVMGALVVALLFASYTCSAMSMRFYGNATLIVSMPVASPERQRLNPVASHWVQRAGALYSWSLRLFLMVVPAVAGVVHPLALVPATLVLLVALHFFDQPPPHLPAPAPESPRP
ncbi:MAG: hypothetical protein ABS84_11485 [Rubrivivax sp. SCN 71-131]|jgi:hypothetical protein|nr:MAG: hypothetical protein ABS84_11485 [Rubrivivax sp. SCN 71-131]